MAKKSKGPRKPGGTAAIQIVEDEIEQGVAGETQGVEEIQPETESPAADKKPARAGKVKMKAEPASNEQIGIGDIKKAAAFVNSVGGLDKALSLLQILKVAKEVQ